MNFTYSFSISTICRIITLFIRVIKINIKYFFILNINKAINLSIKDINKSIATFKDIEKVAKEVGGDRLEEVYAIHAGREVRVIVKPLATSDDDIVVMAKEIADGIQKTQTYPGTVQVTVIREKRAIEMAS